MPIDYLPNIYGEEWLQQMKNEIMRFLGALDAINAW